MKRRVLMLVAIACGLFLAAVPLSRAQEKLDVAKADEVYRKAVERGRTIATQALELLDTVEALNEKAHGLGIPVSQLPKEDRDQLREASQKLGTLYANNMLEASLARDMRLLNKLYQTSMLLYSQQRNYVEQTGSSKGFDQYFAGLKLDREQHFYMEILLYLQRLVPSELEANPGTPTPN